MKEDAHVVVRQWSERTLAEALGREHRDDPVRSGTGGPAGNARLTAWTGLVLLVLFAVELGTLLSVGRFLSWHVVVGVLLVPPALLKTASTGWRIVRYYTGDRAYRQAGPPPMPLRLLGPLVVLFTLAVLGTGLALVFLGPDASRTPLLAVLGQRVDAVRLHQATFLVWAVVTGLHTLARIVPAVRLTFGAGKTRLRIPGRVSRAVTLPATLLVAAVAATLVLGASGAWLTGGLHRPDHHRASTLNRTTP
ncbi:hypothetical protein ORV05_16340 [Amycolatopsis cynarae]|uniref:Cytochrome b561 bacterial/Ni-hydrogenase domain-containing protein n=1 Tax=Amycolatopsis cynarae TaxID=2995223 RepID=A0ABY7BBA1_9PSEU|nr:hypothetical protein [Amycolatopsis sp. HUAS 11-8]WAL69267.1 hypothetical protein ORV05_16340 [Amycolatopsis sp. HUAS 11-8]